MSDENYVADLNNYYKSYFEIERVSRQQQFDLLPDLIKAELEKDYGNGLAVAIRTIPLSRIIQNLAIKLFMEQTTEPDAELDELDLNQQVRLFLELHGWE